MAVFPKWIEAAAEVFNLSKLAEIATEPAKKEYAIRNHLLPDPAKTPAQFLTDAATLNPAYRIANFEYRTDEFDRLSSWVTSDQPFAWYLVHGDTGRGKTRLMVELCAHFNSHKTGNDWIAGFLNVEAFNITPLSFDILFDTPKPLLIVLDYAERQSPIVTQLLKRSAQRAIDTPDRTTRIVLVARRNTDIWNEIFNADTQLQEIGRSRLVDFKLEPVTKNVEVPQVFETAFNAFATHFKKSHQLPALDFSSLSGLGVNPDIGLVHMLALLAVRAPEELKWQTNNRPTRDELLQFMLEREQRSWNKLASSKNMPTELCRIDVLSEAAALLTLAAQTAAIPNASEARNTLRNKSILLKGQTEAQLNQIVDLFRQAYPGIGYVNGVAPDLLGDFLIMQQADDQ